MRKLTRRGVLLGSGAALGALGTRYLYTSGDPERPAFPASGDHQATGGTVLNDASELNPVRVAKHLTFAQDPKAELIARLRAELKEARNLNRPVVASAARHSMGGQSLPEDGLAVTLDQTWLEVDTAARNYRVAAGARWRTVIQGLDALGFSPAVMQSSNDFGVASTFCVNAHGWPVPFGPFGSTVRSLNLMLADGELVECSRSNNAELFAMTMGGYGLTGIITELEVEMVPNTRLEPKFEVVPAADFGGKFADAATQSPPNQMAFGRMNVAIDDFLDEAVIVTYRQSEAQTDLPSATGSGLLGFASRKILRAQLGSDRMKDLRWKIEIGIAPILTGGTVTRNSLINNPVIALEDRDPGRSDILHEYFVAPSRFADFVAACQAVIPSSYQELLNVTLRYVDTDDESVLAYATEPRIAAVMLFSQEKTLRGEADMTRMTRALIEAVLEMGGTYYLPYRLHATAEQFARGYAGLSQFVACKRARDPTLVFRNALWDQYMMNL